MLLCDMSTGVPRPYIPQQFRQAVFDSLHAFTITPQYLCYTQHLITSRYISGLTSTKICISGLDVAYNVKSKIHHHTTVPLGKFTTPDGRLANMTSLDPFHLLKDAFTYY